MGPAKLSSYRIRSSARSDVGRGRSQNEDFFVVDGSSGFFGVADGMGGHGNGDVASRIATQAIQEVLEKARVRGWGRARRRSKDHSERLRRALEEANRRIRKAAEADRSLVGMGATAVVILFQDEEGFIANVGDSRAYRLRAGALRQLTDDHTWVREQISAGLLSEVQAQRHPFRSVVTRALGGDESIEVDMHELDPMPGDLYLLCSDGLTAVLSDEEIRGCLEPDVSLERLCRRLVDEANARGGPDNITVVLVAIDEAPSAPDLY